VPAPKVKKFFCASRLVPAPKVKNFFCASRFVPACKFHKEITQKKKSLRFQFAGTAKIKEILPRLGVKGKHSRFFFFALRASCLLLGVMKKQRHFYLFCFFCVCAQALQGMRFS
jgi:hypothetical protein